MSTEPIDRHPQPSFFAQFPYGRRGQVFAIVDTAAWSDPAVPGVRSTNLDVHVQKEHALLAVDEQHTRGSSGVFRHSATVDIDAVSRILIFRAQGSWCHAVAMVSIGSVVMNVGDIRRAAQFWTSALGYMARGDEGAILVPETGDGPFLLLDQDDRTHLDLWTANAAEQQAEVERLIELGGTRVDWPYPDDADFVVLADTEGNLFCVVDAGR